MNIKITCKQGHEHGTYTDKQRCNASVIGWAFTSSTGKTQMLAKGVTPDDVTPELADLLQVASEFRPVYSTPNTTTADSDVERNADDDRDEF